VVSTITTVNLVRMETFLTAMPRVTGAEVCRRKFINLIYRTSVSILVSKIGSGLCSAIGMEMLFYLTLGSGSRPGWASASPQALALKGLNEAYRPTTEETAV